MEHEGLQIRAFEVKHLPIISAFAQKLGLVEEIDSRIRGEMEISPGRVVLAMVLDALSGRSPPVPDVIECTISRNNDALDVLTEHSGCFILLTNKHSPDDISDRLDSLDVLQAYNVRYNRSEFSSADHCDLCG